MSSPTLWTLSDHVTKHIAQPRLGDTKAPSLWPSAASARIENKHGEKENVGACRRASYLRYACDLYAFNKVDKRFEKLAEEIATIIRPPDKYMRWIWIAGNLFETYVINQAKESGVYLADQIQLVISDYNIVGKLDILIVNPLTGNPIAQEVKSIYGYNATEILGTVSQERRGVPCAPRDSNLMQAALYSWHLSKRMPTLEATRLFYGARDTGRFAEFEVSTVKNPSTGITNIKHQRVSPFLSAPIESPITIDSILEGYSYVLEAIDNQTLPPRDYEISYSQDRIKLLHTRKELSKTDSETYEKYISREEENLNLIANNKKPKKALKPLEKGDWPCSYCNYRDYCYDKNNNPIRD